MIYKTQYLREILQNGIVIGTEIAEVTVACEMRNCTLLGIMAWTKSAARETKISEIMDSVPSGTPRENTLTTM